MKVTRASIDRKLDALSARTAVAKQEAIRRVSAASAIVAAVMIALWWWRRRSEI